MAFHALGIRCPEDFVHAGTQADFAPYTEPEFMDLLKPVKIKTSIFGESVCDSELRCIVRLTIRSVL